MWRLIGRRFEVHIAKSAPSPAGHLHRLSFLSQIAQEFAGIAIPEHGSDRYFHDHVLAIPAVHATWSACLSAGGDKTSVASEAEQGVQTAVGPEDNAAALARVSTIGSTQRHVLLSPKVHGALAAVPGADKYSGFIKKRMHELSPRKACDWQVRDSELRPQTVPWHAEYRCRFRSESLLSPGEAPDPCSGCESVPARLRCDGRSRSTRQPRTDSR